LSFKPPIHDFAVDPIASNLYELPLICDESFFTDQSSVFPRDKTKIFATTNQIIVGYTHQKSAFLMVTFDDFPAN
jgi:hypothetical protein